MRNGHHVAVIIPVLNEAETIGGVLDSLPDWVDTAIVADNGSTDGTSGIAARHGATVVHEPRRGYGAACLKAMAALPWTGEATKRVAVVFLDGDGSDDAGEMARLVDPIALGAFDVVLGSRTRGPCEPGALSIPQRFGSLLSSVLMERLFRIYYSDLGPFRAIRLDKLAALEMDDLDFGWTVQMQARAAVRNLAVLEAPVRYRHRAGGQSKVSGTIRGVFGAGTTILKVIFKEASIAKHQKRRGRDDLEEG
jgi:glycosyltransferase involved in cell wall biosynthesis